MDIKNGMTKSLVWNSNLNKVISNQYEKKMMKFLILHRVDVNA